MNILKAFRRIGSFSLLFIATVVCSSFKPIIPLEYGLKTVVIDAGHGGKDPGKIGVGNVLEKNVALSIALMTGTAIKNEYKDVKVVYTRDNDEFVSLYERARIANRLNADLFISVHANAAANKSAQGTETFTLGLHRTQANLETAKAENAVILMEDNYEAEYEGFDPNSDESNVALTLMQSAFLEQSLSIADKVQQEFTELGRRDRGVKQAGFLVLYKTTMPSILIETGFVTNAEESQYLNKKDNQKVIANAISKAFGNYKAEIEGREQEIENSLPPALPEDGKSDFDPSADKSGILFKVQIASSSIQLELKPENFKGLKDVEELKVNDVFKYTYGSVAKFDDALKIQEKLRKAKYKDAFLIAVKNGKRITISEALQEKK